jgi:hypothetical protein
MKPRAETSPPSTKPPVERESEAALPSLDTWPKSPKPSPQKSNMCG